MRPEKDDYFMLIVNAVRQRSTCLRRQIGAVIVQSAGHVLATGYNGAPRGLRHCLSIGCMRDRESIPSGEQQQRCRAVHAEQNALLQASAYTGGQTLPGSTLYCSVSPCVICARMIINAGIQRVVFAELYPDALATEMLQEAGVKTSLYPGGWL